MIEHLSPIESILYVRYHGNTRKVVVIDGSMNRRETVTRTHMYAYVYTRRLV